MIPFKRYCPETYTDLTGWVTHSLTYFDCYPLTLWKIQNIKYKNQYERNNVNDNALKLLSTNWKDHAGLCFSSAELLTVLPYWATFDVSWNHRMLTCWFIVTAQLHGDGAALKMIPEENDGDLNSAPAPSMTASDDSANCHAWPTTATSSLGVSPKKSKDFPVFFSVHK